MAFFLQDVALLACCLGLLGCPGSDFVDVFDSKILFRIGSLFGKVFQCFAELACQVLRCLAAPLGGWVFQNVCKKQSETHVFKNTPVGYLACP